MKNKIIHGNCLDAMKEMANNSFEAVITSPPYNMNLRINGNRYVSRQLIKEISTKYEDFSDNMKMDDFYLFNKSVLSECLRLSDLVFYNIQILTGNKPAFFRLMGDYHHKIKELIIWDKGVAQPAIGKKIMNSQFELLLVLQNSRPMSRSFETARFERGVLSNLWKIKRGKKALKSHGASFPVELVDEIIKNFIEPGSTILDPFIGTGTVAESCLKNNCSFVGIDLSEDYCNFARNRIETLNLDK